MAPRIPKATPKAQLDAEIANALATGKSLSGHSKKALETLTIMGTKPDQWQLTPIEWVEEERDVSGLVTCPSCDGHKFIVRDASGEIVPRPKQNRTPIKDEDYTAEAYVARNYMAGNPVYDYDQIARKQAYATGGQNAGMYGNCPTCTKRQRGWLVPSGTVKGTVRAKVMVGYPKFPPRTVFDSRYGHNGSACGLCNKFIMKSWRVPVHGVDSLGISHGMWVGEDCATKFLDIKLKRKADSIMETGNGQASEK